MNQSSRARDGAPSGFRIIVPDYCRPGQVICVQARAKTDRVPELFQVVACGQGPDGQQVEVTVPTGVGPGQPMWVQARRSHFRPDRPSPMGPFAGPATCQCQRGGQRGPEQRGEGSPSSGVGTKEIKLCNAAQDSICKP